MKASSENFFSQTLLPYGGLILTIFLVYGRTLGYGLTYLDDQVWLKDHYWFFKNFSNVSRLFIRPDSISSVFYRPILNFSFMMDAQFSKDLPWGYHLTNFMIHVVACCLVAVFLRKLDLNRMKAFGFALLFSVHPALAGAVAWIPGRTDSLLAVFVLAAFIFFIHAVHSGRKRYFLAHLLFYILALLTKETAVVLPILCWLWKCLISEKEEDRNNPAPPWRGLLLGWVVATLSWLMIRQNVLTHSPSVPIFYAIQTLIQNSPAILSYWGKIFWPLNLSVLPIRQDTMMIYGALSFIVILMLLWCSRERKTGRALYQNGTGRVIFGAVWFLLFLIPSLVLSFIEHEYRLYLPMIGCFVILNETVVFKKWLMAKNRSMVFFAVTAGLLVPQTFRHSDHFNGRWAFWRNAVESSPHSSFAHRNLGAMYYLEGLFPEAEEEFKKALALSAKEPMAHNNLGLIYMRRGWFKESEEEFLREIEINRDYDNVYFNLGTLYYAQEKKEQARKLWQRTLALNPDFIQAYQSLGILYWQDHQPQRAEYYFNELRKRGIDVPVK